SRPPGTIAAAAVPQADEAHLVDPTCECRVEQPQVAALERVDALRERSELLGHDARRILQLRFHRVKAVAPLVATLRGQERALDEFGLGQRELDLAPYAALLTGLQKQQVTASGPLGQRQVFWPRTQLSQRFLDLLRRNRFLVEGEPRLGATRCIDHVAAE